VLVGRGMSTQPTTGCHAWMSDPSKIDGVRGATAHPWRSRRIGNARARVRLRHDTERRNDNRGLPIAERLIDANGVELCTESLGDPADPPILLVMGFGGSMLWWQDGFCRLLARRGRFVIRYDQRDTGRSTTYEPGHPGYTGRDLLADAVALLDEYRLDSAHLVGVSAGGALVQLLALDYPGRVESLVLISTSPATPGDRSLPPPNPAFAHFVRSATVDWSDAESVIDYLVAYAGVLAGEKRRFEEAEVRDLVRRDIARARDFAALQNHDLLEDDDTPREPLSSIEAPTLVVHGTADPMFPFPHGKALASEIPNARLLPLEGAGHGVQRGDWETITEAIATHTAVRANEQRSN
jgi:pimeloyl-ACP methyl ester carboxylesterase